MTTRRRAPSTSKGPFRRASTLIVYWDQGRLVVHNYLTRARVVADPALIPFLHGFSDSDVASGVLGRRSRIGEGDSRKSAKVARALRELARHTLLEPDRTPDAGVVASWGAWSPLAAAFHFGTRDVNVDIDLAASERQLTRRAKHDPMPPPVKRAPKGARRTPLPKARTQGEFAETLLTRRTWRDFGRRPVPLQDVATLLALTWGVQQWAVAPGQGRVALKTSPSGGACHPGEVYLLAVRVAGLAPGLYHYQSDRHALALVRKGAPPADITRYLPGQPWYRRAGALFLMTAVFDRARWRYPGPRAYRVVLADAGHLCQTFCLVASWLKLAPFCSMALADSVVDRDLGLDGRADGVIYAAGVGTRPAGGWRPGVPGLRV